MSVISAVTLKCLSCHLPVDGVVSSPGEELETSVACQDRSVCGFRVLLGILRIRIVVNSWQK